MIMAWPQDLESSCRSRGFLGQRIRLVGFGMWRWRPMHPGFSGIALMDHLIQIPSTPCWSRHRAMPTLGLLAGLDTNSASTLVSPVTFREPGIIAKTVATLDALSDRRAFCGLGAGWWLREHQAYGLDFPSDRQRLDQLQVCIETLRALWAPGTSPYHGRYVHLPETTCYPRPVSYVPIIVGGSGERRTLRIVAEQADACNLPSKPSSTASQDRHSCGGIAQCWAATPQAWRSPYWTCR